jgi:hypothetical protein
MPKSTTMTLRIPPDVSEKLEALARDTKRTKAYLAGEAIASYVEHNALRRSLPRFPAFPTPPKLGVLGGWRELGNSGTRELGNW